MDQIYQLYKFRTVSPVLDSNGWKRLQIMPMNLQHEEGQEDEEGERGREEEDEKKSNFNIIFRVIFTLIEINLANTN